MDLSKTGQSQIEKLSFTIAALFCLALGLLFGHGERQEASDQQIELKGRINPNEAPAVSMVRLPQIGLVRASAIIEYRNSEAGSGRAFSSAKDLEKVKGIGPKTAGRIGRWLEFE